MQWRSIWTDDLMFIFTFPFVCTQGSCRTNALSCFGHPLVYVYVCQNKISITLTGVFNLHTSWDHTYLALSAGALSINKCSNTSCDQQIPRKRKHTQIRHCARARRLNINCSKAPKSSHHDPNLSAHVEWSDEMSCLIWCLSDCQTGPISMQVR